MRPCRHRPRGSREFRGPGGSRGGHRGPHPARGRRAGVPVQPAGGQPAPARPATVAAIFQQRVERWDDPRIAADNPGVDLPPTTVWPVHRSDSSGSTSILGEYLSAAAAGEWTLGAGKTLAWPPGGLAAERSDGVTAAVDAEPGGITYAELSFAARQGLPTAALANPSGQYVTANALNVPAALANAVLDEHHADPRMLIDYTPTDPAAYPASAVTYGIVCAANNAHPELLRSYLGYVLSKGQESTDEIGYASVGGAAANRARQLAATIS
ncbi:extracellular solute-binding protein [Parafrankia sp. Ea1.12]|uniref:extracellular solute-binding protein n=1 Tax=unclassified Parafrankia TaxID=2994368 RepID=UPI0034CFD7D1